MRKINLRSSIFYGALAIGALQMHSQNSTPNNCTQKVFIEKNGIVAIEAEDFISQSKTNDREWLVLDKNTNNTPKPDPDGNHADSASSGKYIELLPDTRVKHADPLVNGVSFSNKPGEVAIINYRVKFSSAGKYFVWVRAFSTGSEDNGVHVGINGNWPASGARMQWCSGKNQWTWESKQRTAANHCGEPQKIFLNIPSAGEHTISFSMREDGFEMDKFILSKAYTKPSGEGIAAQTDCTTVVTTPTPTTPTTPTPPVSTPTTGTNTPAGTQVSGQLMRWHKVSLTFDGPDTSETANPNPFTDYNLEVTFIHKGSNRSYKIPGYFAACGNAANNSCTSGNKWRVNFSPDQIGGWNWKASFKKGANVAINGGGSAAGFMNGKSGSFDIAESNKSGKDFRNKGLGRLQYVGEHYLKHTGTNPTSPNGPWFLKAGADSPENAFNYVDFDATPSFKNNLNKIGSKTWQPHQRDYAANDAQSYTWNNNKGTEILGMINYLSGQGANVVSFLTWNAGGDGGAVFPHLLKGSVADYEKNGGNRNAQWNKMHHNRFDVSKMDQWEKVMEYADKKGMYLHFKTMETENDNKMDGNKFGNERKIYYRQLIAHFGHHLALNWNLTEETTIPDNVVKSTASYIKNIDPYDHNIVIHTFPGKQDQGYNPLIGNQSVLTGASIQTDKNKVHNDVKRWIEKSRKEGRKWVVANDEQGSAGQGIRVSDKEVRHKVLWGTLIAGGAGVEYYSGYTDDDGDINGNDHRKRGRKYKEGSYALAFFNTHLQAYMVDMNSADNVTADGKDYVLAKNGEIYAIYRPNGGSTGLNLPNGNNKYDVQWYNPRTGGNLTAKKTLGGNLVAPDKEDWVALITKKGGATPSTTPVVTPNPTPTPTQPTTPTNPNCSNTTLAALSDFTNLAINGFSPAYKDNARKALGINAAQHKNKFAAAETNFSGQTGTYNIKLNTLAELDGESTYRLRVNGTLIGTYKNPETTTDYSPAGKTFTNVSVKNGDKIRVEFSSHTNGKIPENGGTAFSRGRWTGLEFICTGSTTPTTPTTPVVTPNPTTPPVTTPPTTPSKPDTTGGYSPIHDAYLEGNKSFNTSIVRVEGNERTAHLLFDLSKVKGKITKASLEFTVNGDAGNGTVKVYKGTSTNWTETNLSAANAPGKGKELGNTSGTYTIGKGISIPLSANDISKGKISLVVEQTSGNDFAFSSKENGNATAPKLILDIEQNVEKTTKFNALQDAFMQGDKRYNTEMLRTENGKRTTYLKFDLRKVNTIKNANLELIVDGDAGNGTIEVYQGTDSGWTEFNLNKSNEPTTLKKVGSTSGNFTLGKKVNIKLTNIDKKNYVTLIVKQTSGNDVAFASKENGNKGPKLALTYTENTGAKIGVEDFNINVNVYPNPTVNSVTVSSENLSQLSAINVYDLNGTLLNKVIIDKEKPETVIDLSNYSNGIYLLSLQSDTNKLKIIKVVKE